ncbi:hypothetical protein ACE1TF_08745 [Geomicrobium sp. JSM 1781026]|uniref:hypothetical protein n=1 Tax=Geomicrobium sp. JSM 1781026 TaxID=3344580 RepID=UPI0035BF487B
MKKCRNLEECCEPISMTNNLINGPSNVEQPPIPTTPTVPTVPTTPTVPTVPTGLNKVYGIMPLSGNTAVYNGFDESRVGTLPTFTFSRVFAIAVDPFRNLVYLAATTTPGTIYVFSAVDEQLITSFNLSIPNSQPQSITINYVTNKIYIGTLTGRLFVLDRDTLVEEEIIGEGVFPLQLTDVAINQQTNILYVISGGLNSNELNVVNGATNEIIGPFTDGLANPADVVVIEQTNTIYISNNNAGTVTVYDGSTLDLIAEIVVGARPNLMDFDPLRNELYVVNQVGSVTVIDTTTNTVLGTIDLEDPGANSVSIALNPFTRRAYVGITNRPRIDIIDMDLRIVIGALPIETGAFRVQTLP